VAETGMAPLRWLTAARLREVAEVTADGRIAEWQDHPDKGWIGLAT
jgi:hypothetical protein